MVFFFAIYLLYKNKSTIMKTIYPFIGFGYFSVVILLRSSLSLEHFGVIYMGSFQQIPILAVFRSTLISH